MRLMRHLLLCAGLVLAAGCRHDDLLPEVDDVKTYAAETRSGSGVTAVTQIDFLTLEDDGDFTWNRSMHGDGTGNPSQPRGASYRMGDYRIRNGFLDLRTRVNGSVSATGQVTQTPVGNPQWSGEEYRIVSMDDIHLTLRFIPLESSSRTEVTLEFGRVRPVD